MLAESSNKDERFRMGNSSTTYSKDAAKIYLNAGGSYTSNGAFEASKASYMKFEMYNGSMYVYDGYIANPAPTTVRTGYKYYETSNYKEGYLVEIEPSIESASYTVYGVSSNSYKRPDNNTIMWTLGMNPGSYEKLNIPISQLISNQTYTLSFKVYAYKSPKNGVDYVAGETYTYTDTFHDLSHNYNYSWGVYSSEKKDTSRATGSGVLNCGSLEKTPNTWLGDYTTTFTANSSTMYLVFDLADLQDGNTVNFGIKNLTCTKK